MKHRPTVHTTNWRRLTVLQLSPFAWIFVVLLTARLPEQYLLPIWIFIGVTAFYTAHVVDNWPCPRCKMRFHRRGKYGVTAWFRFRCVNCGLKRGYKGPSGPFSLSEQDNI